MTRTYGFWIVLATSVAFVALGECSVARASCGDYVVLKGQQHDASVPLPDRAESPSRHPSMPIRMPCKGPGCSQNQLPITPPPSVPVPVGEEYWGQADVICP